MSIVDSRAEHVAAAERLAILGEAELVRELTSWTVRARDLHHEYQDHAERMAAIKREYVEADAWLDLVGEELRARRTIERVGGPEVPAAFRDALEAS